AILDALAVGQALFLRGIAERLALPSLDGPSPPDAGPAPSHFAPGGAAPPSTGPSEADIARAIWDLVFAGHLTNDTLAAVRARLGGGRTAHGRTRSAPRARYGRYHRVALPVAGRVPQSGLPGRWSRLPERSTEQTRRALLRTE